MTTTMKSARLSRQPSQPEIFRLTPINEREGAEVKVHTSSAPLTATEEQAIDKLAMLFTIQEERCLSEAGRDREHSQLSRESVSSSNLPPDAAFIYQHIDFQVLSKCVPNFVKSNLNRNARYLPETFILRVNYWRRRRMIGDDSSIMKAKKEKVVRACSERASPSPRASSKGKSPRPSTVSERQSVTST